MGDDELPEGVPYVIVERTEDCPLLLLTERASGPWRFISAWYEERSPGGDVLQFRSA